MDSRQKESMKSKTLFLLSLSLALLIGGTSPSPLQREAMQQDLDALVKRGFTYRMLDNDLIELTDPLSGPKRAIAASCPLAGVKRVRITGDGSLQNAKSGDLRKTKRIEILCQSCHA